MKAKYAATHPGKMGDALYALPFIRYIYGLTGERIDFYTSAYCEPMRSLFEYQPCISSFNIAQNYEVQRMDMGCQPWYMPVEGYEHVFQLGFQSVPDRAIHQFIAKEQGATVDLGIRYDCPELENVPPTGTKYVCVAPRHPSSYDTLFYDICIKLRALDIGVVQIGGKGDFFGIGYDMTGLDLLNTCSFLSKSIGFVGLMSSQLVLANGFDIPRIGVNGYQSDMRHAVMTALNYYPPEGSTAQDILDILEKYNAKSN